MLSRLFSSAAALALSSGVASAGLIFESEPNDTLATANEISSYFGPNGGSLAIDGFITPGGSRGNVAEPGDVDWFTFTVTDLTFIGVTAFAFDLSGGGPLAGGPFPPEADAALELVNSDGQVIAWDDDSGPGLNPSLGAFLAPGTYTIGIAPYEDLFTKLPPLRGKGPGPEVPPELFNGYDEYNGGRPTTANFAYKLIIGVNTAPAPGAATMLGLAGLVATRRRR
jgi:MYXO-CTERM domain-containing protein